MSITYDKAWITDKYLTYIWETEAAFSCDTFLANMYYDLKHGRYFTPLPCEMLMIGLITDIADNISHDSSLDK